VSSEDAGVVITEVGPRDGLQNEHRAIPTAQKIELVDRLSRAGFPEIEVSAFVRPDVVPQLSDAAAVFAGIERCPNTVYSALVPNEQGVIRAVDAGAQKVSVFTAASETFSQKNTNATIDETIERFKPVVQRAGAEGLSIRAYVSCAVACPYEGPTDSDAVACVVERLLSLGPVEIDLGDTIGAATPDDIDRLLASVGPLVATELLVLHLHDTRGVAVSCARRAMELGVRRFDAAVGGLGGCPFAPGAPGNLATESLLTLSDSMGLHTGIDAEAVAGIGQWVRGVLAR
jgi:isopropylmalate/homocitrate/citramalate synthase